MTYMLWKKGEVTPEYTIFADRFSAEKHISKYRDHYQRFSTKETGNISGYAAEINEDERGREKVVALLYPHKIAQDIWIEID